MGSWNPEHCPPCMVYCLKKGKNLFLYTIYTASASAPGAVSTLSTVDGTAKLGLAQYFSRVVDIPSRHTNGRLANAVTAAA